MVEVASGMLFINGRGPACDLSVKLSPCLCSCPAWKMGKLFVCVLLNWSVKFPPYTLTIPLHASQASWLNFISQLWRKIQNRKSGFKASFMLGLCAITIDSALLAQVYTMIMKHPPSI